MSPNPLGTLVTEVPAVSSPLAGSAGVPARQCEHIYLFERVFEKVVSGALLRHQMWEEALLDISAKGGGGKISAQDSSA